MLSALTRGVSASLADCELVYLKRQPIDVALARTQHEGYQAALRELKANVMAMPPMDTLPDAVFVEDTAIVLDEVLVPARMAVASRAGEVFSVAEELAFCRRVLSMKSTGTLEGGDVLRVGRTLFVGLSRRTNQAGIDGLRDILTPFDYKVVPVAIRGCLHLKTACSYLGRNIFFVNSSWVDTRAFRGYEIIEVTSSEPRGANVLMIGETGIVPAEHPLTQKLLSKMGFKVRPVEVSEFLKAEAGVTCLSILFERQEGDKRATKIR